MAKRTLLLIRHAKSSWKDSSLSDRDRPLNKRGKRGAPVVAQRLKDLQISPDLVISSPANRAYSTAKIISEILSYNIDDIQVEEAIYEFSFAGKGPRQIIAQIPDSAQTVILFGHNPTFSGLANDFSDGAVQDMPTCAVACFDFEAENWQGFGEAKKQMRFYIYPKMLSSDL